MIWAKILSAFLGLAEWWARRSDQQAAEDVGAMKQREIQREAVDDAKARMDAAPSRPAADRLRDGTF